MNGAKKLSVRILIILYGISYFLQNTFFINRRNVYAAVNPTTTNIVAVFVDKDIYTDIKTNLIRYTTKYIQKKIANSKAVVLPIDTKTLKAHEISEILENMYFEGTKDQSSKLIGTILIGNIPLPVVENNGFIYPSIYPYVDFEDQQFIYNTNKKFFVYNNNPNGQAELRHGIIKFDSSSEYNSFFGKVRSYYNNPTTFIDKAIWYEDFIGLKKYFIPENTKYYINSMVFSEDIGYHRFNNLLVNTLKDEHNQSTLSLTDNLENNLQNTEDVDLQNYAEDIGNRNATATTVSQGITAKMPTMTLKTATQEMLKGYNGLVSSQFLVKMKNNIAGLARRYKSTDGETYTEYSSVTDKIVQKDNRVLGDIDNNVQPLLIQMNDFMEDKLNTKINDEKYYMTIPISISELNFEGLLKPAVIPKCIWTTYKYYENYYFGKNARQITSAEDTSIYEGTYKNLSSLSGENIDDPLQSVGGSYNVFSTQIEANRGYNINSTKDELARYDILKTNKQELRNKDCNLHLFGYCIRWKKTRKPQDSDDEDKCYINDEEKQGGCETITGFTQRYRGGASPMNINANTQKLTNYNYKNAKSPIYDIAGSKAIDATQPDANSYKGAETYTNLIQERFSVKEKQEEKYSSINSFIDNPTKNGIDIKFTNQIVTNSDLEHPVRAYNAPKTYTQNNFFTMYDATTAHIIRNGKLVLYNRTPATDIGNCNVKGQVYTYKTIDSRVKNIAPTRNQISNTDIYKFKESSDLERFYINVMADITGTQLSITNKKNQFSGANAADITGVVSTLLQLKTLIASGNNGMQEIVTFNPVSLLSMNATQVANKANDRSAKNLNQTKIVEMSGKIAKVNAGLDELLDYMNNLNIDNTMLYFTNIIQTEKFKNQPVEILDIRKTQINSNLNGITTQVNALKSTFSNARGIYNTIGQINNNIIAINAQKTVIATLHAGNGCASNHYQSICNVLTNITTTLQNNLTHINEMIDEIDHYEYQDAGNTITVEPFNELNGIFTTPNIASDITWTRNTMNTFAVSSDPNKKEINKGMNLTTQDRPIDNIRNITFKGIGGDVVRLDYPNLYEVNVYKEVNNTLVLKTPTEIRDAIKEYLVGKAEEYNTLLNEQKNKRNAWYQSLSNKFIMLGTIDPLANPNTHNYGTNPIDSNYFVNQIIEYLDTLEDAPLYGTQAIYGISKANTTDEKLDMLAKLLYYQNITWPERVKQTTVTKDIQEIKTSFDINHKVSYITNTYLTEGKDQGKFITPIYNTTGYEMGYINSDGEDYISSQPVPTFIRDIQNTQEQASVKNTFIEASSDILQQEIDACEGIDTNGTALIFDFKTFSSPRGKAMKCWAKKILKEPFKFEVSFKNALGPVFAGTLKDIGNTFTNRKSERNQYGNERGSVDNNQIISEAPANIQEILKGYNTNAIVNIDKTIISIDDTNFTVKIGMMQDVGKVRVKISGTGDNCFMAKKNETTISQNICNNKAEGYYNPNKEDYTFKLILNEKKSGTTALKIELCPSAGDKCIIKQQVINILPGPIDQMDLQASTNIVMEGGEIPIIVSATDNQNNTIGQSIQAYTISVNSGDGQLYDGTTSNSTIKFDKFPGTFIYKAPIGIQDNKNIIITTKPDTTSNILGANESVTMPLIRQKTIEVAKGIVTVINNGVVVHQSNNHQSIQPKITFNLPKDEKDIQYMDTDGMAQIQPNRVSSIRITIKDVRQGRPLTTVANVVSTQGLLKPGTMEQRTITTATGTKTQYVFKQVNDFIIHSGTQDITLYPSFKAGNDTITINIPGIDPIIIPVVVNPGPAKTVLMKLEKSRLDLTSTTSSKGTIQVVDTRNNKVTTGTKIKLGVIGAANISTNEFIYSGNEYTYTITAKKPGGEGYAFAYIGTEVRTFTDQIPAYERFIIQDSILPQSGLNVMYLNLFGTDRGNQRGYFSENDKTINTITNQSNKLLATTTELVDPNKIKQIEYIISPNAQIQSIGNKQHSINIENGELVAVMPEMAKIHLGASEEYTIKKLANSGAVETFEKNENTLLYIPEQTDSIITSNEANTSKITINGIDIIDINQGTIDQNVIITADNEVMNDINTYTITYQDKTIGTLLIRSNDNITTNTNNVDIQDPITYGKTSIFTEGSSNTQGIGIYINSSAFSKQGYASIEDSSDAMLGIGFTSDFKNAANFANGQMVGDATLPYGSHFLINFGDPLLERREKNPNIPDTDFDASIGQTIYADPTKTIFKTIPIDFNSDGLKDMLVVYTDGVVKLLKNYGGTQPYKNLQELMIIAEPIKDIIIGDVDGKIYNGKKYDDIFITTTNNKGIVYLNNAGIFPVDGKNVCLNVNTEPTAENPNPDDFSSIKQLFVQDMDRDGKIDVITNDSLGDLKIFYGGTSNNGANYVSSVTGTCDENWYQRQKNNYKIVKRFGIKVNSSRHIQDGSLVHRKGLNMPMEGVEEEIEEPETPASINTSNNTSLDEAMNQISNVIANTDMYIAAGSSQLAYTENPLSTSPVYETIAPEEIYYLPINETNDAASIYKEYVDMNGGVLRIGDEVVIKTTIVSKKNYNKLTYIDQLQGPRAIAKNDDNRIPSLVFMTNNTGSIDIDRNGPEGYQFVIDNVQLNSGARLSFSYTVTYQQQTDTTTIDVEDQNLLEENKHKDQYPDIGIYSTDSCIKNRWILFNETIGNKRTYEQIYDNIQEDITAYNSGATAAQTTALNTILDQISSTDSLESASNLPGLSNLESWTAGGIISSLIAPGGVSVNLGVLNKTIDNATAGVSKKIDAALQGLCQGFKLGENGGSSCQGTPLPFNQAFLAPGDYHVFGCVPKLPNPLYGIFKTLNTTLGKGMPVLNIPGNRPSPVGYLPVPGLFGFPFKGATDGFFLGAQGGAYPSQVRIYIAPTLTLGLGIAMCFGPYTVGKALPKPFRDLGGNCIVFAVPPLTTCQSSTGSAGLPTTESLGSSMVAAAKVGTCNTPPKIGNTIVFAGEETTTNNSSNNSDMVVVSTANSPLQIVAAGSNQNNPSYSAAIPQGNFGGLISMDQDPTRVSANEDYGNALEQTETSYEGYNLTKGAKTKLKIVGAKTKGLVQCVVQDRTTRQIQYIQNNLTKMTIQIDLPNISTVFQGFDKIGNLGETYKSLNAEDKAEGYIQAGTSVDTNITNETGSSNRTQYLSQQQLKNISKEVGENPFEAIQKIFKEVPLINIDSKDINLKIPALTSEDINKYVSYLQLRVDKNAKIMEDWTSMINQMLAMCGTTDKAEAKKMKARLDTYKNGPAFEKLGDGEKKRINGQIKDMEKILALSGNTTRQDMGSEFKNIGINAKNTATKIGTLPYWKALQLGLNTMKAGQNVISGNINTNKVIFTDKEQGELDAINGIVTNLEQCSQVSVGLNKFLSFRENTAGLIISVKENIKVLEKYKAFPKQLYQWTHITDRYLTEISSLISDTLGSLTNRLDTNATRFSQYVDAITLLVGAIKTRQAIIDFSVNRSEKCSKCSNDNYGSFSCSLSFLCPKLPIFPIPAFKIPSVYMDLSHIELGLNIVLPKINFVPINIPLPQLPNLPEPPTIEVDRAIMQQLKIDFFQGMSLPTIPVIPEPPTLPEPPSFIPTISMKLPVLPPAPKIPKILPEINAILDVAEFIGKIFCIVKGGIGLVGEKGVKGKVEQITQRTRTVPVFDFFNMTTKFKDPPLQGFDYQVDAYSTLKFNFDGVYDVFNTLAQTTNSFVSEKIEAPIQKAVERSTEKLNDNSITSGLDAIENFDQNINFNGYMKPEEEATGMIEYSVAYNDLRQGLMRFKNSTLTDKDTNNKVKTLLATIENKSTVLPATNEIHQIEEIAQGIVDEKIQENKKIQTEIENYDTFIQKIKNNKITLVDNKTIATSLKAPILTVDSTTKNMLAGQEHPTKTYLTLNQKMVQGYLDAVNNDGAEKLNMSQTTYKKSKAYLETTKEKIDTALLAYNENPTLAQGTCTNCSSQESNNYGTDISMYVKGVFIETYSGDENSSGSVKSMVNTVVSTEHIANVEKTYTTNVDINNDELSDILMYDSNTIYVKYAQQETEYLSEDNNTVTTYYNGFYSYEIEHPGTRIRPQQWYIKSLDQLKENSDTYGYTKIKDITIKVVDNTKEVKNFRTEGQTFDNLQLAWNNSKLLGESVDGYIIKVSNKVDQKDTPSSFWDIFGTNEKSKYILVLPKGTDYKKGLITIDENMTKRPINLELDDNILAVEEYNPEQQNINLTFKNLPRKRLYISLAALTIRQDELTDSQKKSFTLYKKTSPRSNQTVAGMQNLGDEKGPVGEITLRRNMTNETMSTGVAHEGYINTNYTLKSTWTDDVVVKKMIIQKDGVTILEKNNQLQTGTIDKGGLFFTGNAQESFDFIAIDQNNNITKEHVTLNIKIPGIEVVNLKKSGEETAEIIAKISNDMDEGMVIFQRLRNGIRNNIEGTLQNNQGGFNLSPNQTIITGGTFTIGKNIGLFNNLGDEIATINPETGKITINSGYENTTTIKLNFSTHIPVIELRDTIQNITLFQIVLPIESIKRIQMNTNQPDYEALQLPDGGFGDFNNGYCIKNIQNDCILYTNDIGAIYIPGMYANSLVGEYLFDNTNQNTTFIVKDQSNHTIVNLVVKIKPTQ